MGRYIRGRIDLDTALSTLGAGTALRELLTSTVNERTIVTSTKTVHSLSNMTPILDSGSVEVGVAHSDYSLAEIQAWSDLSTGWDEGDKGSQEIAKRLIRTIGIFEVPDDALDAVTLNDGKPIKIKLNWILNQGQTLQYWYKNNGTAALATTDPNAQVSGHANLFAL